MNSFIHSGKYTILRRFIILQFETQTSVTLNEMIDASFKEFMHEDRNALATSLLRVKRDLHARGILRIKFDQDRVQHITLVRRKKMFKW